MKKMICKTERISPDDGAHYFFGYYDKCPWSRDGERILAHRTAFCDHFPAPDDIAEVGFLKNGRFHKLAETTAWNWQQGAQLQWISDKDDTENIIFNRRMADGTIRACILNPESKTERLCSGSIYTVHPSGKFALTLNYARLYDMRRDYGIAGLIDPHRDKSIPEDDGIFRVDLTETHMPKLLLSMAELRRDFCPDTPTNVKYKINHLMFNPSGDRFCFMLRYTTSDGMGHSVFFSAGLDGSGIRMLRRGMISHYGWRDNRSLVAWAGDRKILGTGTGAHRSPLSFCKRTLKPIYYALGKPRILMNKIIGDSYWLLDDSPELNHHKIAEGKLTTDGHCTVLKGGRRMLTDGYTDRQNKLPLFLYDLENGRKVELGRYFTPRELDKELRVDLHPRGNHDGTRICIDSAMSGKRAMYVIDIANLLGA